MAVTVTSLGAGGALWPLSAIRNRKAEVKKNKKEALTSQQGITMDHNFPPSPHPETKSKAQALVYLYMGVSCFMHVQINVLIVIIEFHTATAIFLKKALYRYSLLLLLL